MMSNIRHYDLKSDTLTNLKTNVSSVFPITLNKLLALH